MASAKPWWLAFVAGTALAAALARSSLDGEQRAFLMPGQMTHGHYQIELACEQCHTPDSDDMQQACLGCHGEALDQADDSHPPRKFRDPRNAELVLRIDARLCVTCHAEHQPDATLALGLTQPLDFCVHCHRDVGAERPTHVGLGFETCQSDGCHNFHDNRALNEDFLGAHVQEPPLLGSAAVWPLTLADAGVAPAPDAPAQHRSGGQVEAEWSKSAHALAGVNCSDCHDGEGSEFDLNPDRQVCARCHPFQVSSFEGGKHGMRLAVGLSPMTPRAARLPMRPDAVDRQLSCVSCHGAHRFDRGEAAVEACLGCHADAHSLAYRGSAHERLWAAEQRGDGADGTGVSCATCHLPRTKQSPLGGTHAQHNQNANLGPPEKMVRSVCMHCHGLEFTLSALLEPALIERNFDRPPQLGVQSLQWVRDRRAQGP